MQLDWIILLAAVAATALLVWRQRGFRHTWFRGGLGVLCLIALLGAKTWERATDRGLRSRRDLLETTPDATRRESYVTSDKCQSCHPDQYHSWYHSFHRTMTQYASPETVLSDITKLTLNARGERYHLERRGREFWVDMPDVDWKVKQATRLGLSDLSTITNAPRTWRRVGLVTGSHHQQKLWVGGTRGNMQYNLPFSYLIEEGRWVLREDTIVRDSAKPLLLQIWNANCLKCHSTAFQPRWDRGSGRFETRVAEMGIACEACHGPAQRHVTSNLNPVHRYRRYLENTPDNTIVNPAKLNPKRASDVCAQCHGMKLPLSADWEQDGFRFRPGDHLQDTVVLVQPSHRTAKPWLDLALDMLRKDGLLDQFFWSDGQIRILREYNGMMESKCFTRGDLSCLSCHSMHSQARDPAGLARWADDQLKPRMRGNQACLQCHDSYRTKLEKHTHHPRQSSGSQCYNCHMPHTVWGLLKAVRSHQITSPTVQESLATGRPNACNLCHLDQTLDWTARRLNAWYGTPMPPGKPSTEGTAASVGWVLSGDAAQRAFLSWHMGWKPAQQISGKLWMVPFLAELLVDPYSAVRYRASRSLRSVPGFEDLDYDFVGPVRQRQAAKNEALARWKRRTGAPRFRGERLLIQPDGALDRTRMEQLLKHRDLRPVFLVE